LAFKYTRELKIGMLAIVTATMIYNGVKFLKGTDFLTRENKFMVVYDNIDGLVVGNSVAINGLAVGRVNKLELDLVTQRRVYVTLDIDKKIPIGNGTVAILANDGLLGGKKINLKLGANSKLYVGDGTDTLVPELEINLMTEATAKLSPMLRRADSLTVGLNDLVNDFRGTVKVLNKTLSSVESSSNTANDLLNANQKNIKSITTNVDGLTASLSDTEKKLKHLISKINVTADSLNKAPFGKTLRSAEKTLSTFNATLSSINNGNGTLGKLAKNDSLYRNLNQNSEALTKLLNDFRERPKRYVHFSLFGRKGN